MTLRRKTIKGHPYWYLSHRGRWTYVGKYLPPKYRDVTVLTEPLTHQEAGRRRGNATLAWRGRDHFRRIGAIGGRKAEPSWPEREAAMKAHADRIRSALGIDT